MSTYFYGLKLSKVAKTNCYSNYIVRVRYESSY